ncbi:TPA: GNAT family N-acetyltransferase [Shewanella algae]|uniref:GNAT family N-acetyltransferase n=1 Tax=Shewanella algae TaxID=38313 RepID=UPI001C566B60|nr:GNAT family N-acetyltransferase [Shewanella algae]HDS1207483.1 GNAT family N-acetyltransferase [Shewanella algae]
MIRTATHADMNAIVSIGKVTLEKSPTYPVTLDDNKARYMVRRCISDRSMEIFVAVVDGEVVGFIMGMMEEHWFSKDCYATDLTFCVLPEHGDQAVWLLRRFIRWAKSFPKVKSILLGVSSGMDADGRIGQLYERHGFTIVGGFYSLIFSQEAA